MEGKRKLVYTAFRIVGQVYYALIIGLAAMAMPFLLKSGDQRQWVGLAVVAYLTLVYIVLFGNARYHFPMMPWVAMYSGVGAQWVLLGASSLGRDSSRNDRT